MTVPRYIRKAVFLGDERRQVLYPVIDAVTVAMGDMLYYDSVNLTVKPLSSLADIGSATDNQIQAAMSFIGIAMRSHVSGTGATTLPVSTAGVWEMDIGSSTFKTGDLVAPLATSSAASTQTVSLAVRNGAASIGRAYNRGTCVTRIQVDIQPAGSNLGALQLGSNSLGSSLIFGTLTIGASLPIVRAPDNSIGPDVSGSLLSGGTSTVDLGYGGGTYQLSAGSGSAALASSASNGGNGGNVIFSSGALGAKDGAGTDGINGVIALLPAGGSGGLFIKQAAPDGETLTTQAYLASELLGGLITSTQTGAVTGTLDTGANLDLAVPVAYLGVDVAFDWSLINIGSSSGAVTVTASTGHTIVGLATVAINTSARFRTRRTAANTWITYRL